MSDNINIRSPGGRISLQIQSLISLTSTCLRELDLQTALLHKQIQNSKEFAAKVVDMETRLQDMATELRSWKEEIDRLEEAGYGESHKTMGWLCVSACTHPGCGVFVSVYQDVENVRLILLRHMDTIRGYTSDENILDMPAGGMSFV